MYVCNVAIENLGRVMTSFCSAFFQFLKMPPSLPQRLNADFFFLICLVLHFFFCLDVKWDDLGKPRRHPNTLHQDLWGRVSQGIPVCSQAWESLCERSVYLSILLHLVSSLTSLRILSPRHILWHFSCPSLKSNPPVVCVPPSGNAYHSSYFIFLCDIISLIFFFSRLCF